MRAWRRRLAAIAAGVFVLGLLVVIFRPAPVRVDIAPVTRGRLSVTVDEEGRTRVRDRFVVAAPIAGRLARIALDAGDPIERGTVVARMQPLPLDPRTHASASAQIEAADAARLAADARVEQAHAALDQAQRTAERARKLGAKGTIASEELEQTVLSEIARRKELDAAVFAARAAAFGADAARAALLAPGSDSPQQLVAACESQPNGTCLELRSPVSGRVLRVVEESERVVVAGAPLVEIGDPSALEIVVDVLSSEAVKVKAGDQMWIEDWGGSEPLKAVVRLVEPSGFTKISALGVEEQRVNIIGDFVEPIAALGDGYRVDARIVVWEGNDVVKLPSTALFRRAGHWNVFVAHNGRALRRAVSIGQRSNTEVEVLDGVAPGEEVVSHPSDQIEDGVRIAPL